MDGGLLGDTVRVKASSPPKELKVRLREVARPMLSMGRRCLLNYMSIVQFDMIADDYVIGCPNLSAAEAPAGNHRQGAAQRRLEAHLLPLRQKTILTPLT